MENKIKIYEDFLSEEQRLELLQYSIDNPELYNLVHDPDGVWTGRILHCFRNEVAENIQQIMRHYVWKARAEINIAAAPRTVEFDTVNYSKWKEGHVQPPHADAVNPDGSDHPYAYRKYGCVYYLNDDYEGGEIYFPNFDVEVKPKSNTMIFFPGDLDHLHGVREITKGVRHTIASFWRYEQGVIK